jgi:GNAT superfamily N-acetyltransferase
MDLLIRQMRVDDISAGMELKTFANWNQTEADWRIFVEANPEGCLVAECDGRVVGSTTIIYYGSSYAWIGMVLVHPDYRGRGIATRLMKEALDLVTDCPTVKLDATAAGKLVYDKLGFREERVVNRMTATTSNALSGHHNRVSKAPDSVGEIAPITTDNIFQIASQDRGHIGIDRSFLLRALFVRTPDAALQLKRDGRIAAYCLGRQGTSFFQIGPLLAENDQDAIKLVQAVPSQLTGESVVIDVPAKQAQFRMWLEKSGFQFQREFIRMVRGRNEPGDPMQHQYAICGPEFG